MKQFTTLSLITSIGCLIFAFSSCQSNGANGTKASSSNDTDSVSTFVENNADSATTIAEQERIAADKAKEKAIAQEKQVELKKLSKKFNEKKDEFSNKTWIFPKDKPKYRNRNATYCYFMKQDGEAKNLRFVFQYESSDWLFIKDLIFKIDGELFEYRRLDFNTDCGDGRIWEWCDLQLSDINLIRALENAKSIKIKMNGDKYYDTRTLKSNTILSIQNTIKYYKALGGEL